jgi:hypothetical protein
VTKGFAFSPLAFPLPPRARCGPRALRSVRGEQQVLRSVNWLIAATHPLLPASEAYHQGHDLLRGGGLPRIAL